MYNLTKLWDKVAEDRSNYSAGHVSTVVYQITNNYDWFLLPSLVSLLKFNYVNKVYIITDADELSYTLPNCVTIKNLKDQEYIDKNGPNGDYFASQITLLRSSFCRILNEDKIINLDSDTIITTNIQPLWDIDMGDNYLAMAYEATTHEINPTYTYPNKLTYNIGTNVMNLKQLREDNADEKWRWLINNVNLNCAEQDAAILLFQDKTIELNPLYNACTQTLTSKELLQNPVIVHYAGDSNYYKDDADVLYKIYLEYYKLYIETFGGIKLKDCKPIGELNEV